MTSWLNAASVVLSFAAQAPDTSATVVGTVRDGAGVPVMLAQVRVVGTTQRATTDSGGRFELRGLRPGFTEFRLFSIGFNPLDTALSLRAGERRTLNFVLGVDPWLARSAAAESARAAAGGVDSIQDRLVATDTSVAFSYETFGIQLLRAATRVGSPDSSRVLSPLSAGQALALVYKGARDSTALAVGRVLELNGLPVDKLGARDRAFNQAVRARTDVTLKVANALWVDTAVTLQPSFERWARDYYGASARRLSLTSKEVVRALNRWADSTTNGLIGSIRKDPFHPDIKLVLTNAVYYKGQWLQPFDSVRTQPRPFTTASGRRLQPPTMETTKHLGFRQGVGYKVIRIPYAAGLTAMYVVLPDSALSAAAILDSVSKHGWPLPDLQSVPEVHLRLPRLHITGATNLEPPLTALGMGIAFDPNRADLGGLITPRPELPPPCPPLSSGVRFTDCTRYRLDEATQSVYLDVNERGTEAAAVTAMMVAELTSVPPPPIPFFVDRPFLFAIRDEKTGVFLFMGLIVDPSQ